MGRNKSYLQIVRRKLLAGEGLHAQLRHHDMVNRVSMNPARYNQIRASPDPATRIPMNWLKLYCVVLI